MMLLNWTHSTSPLRGSYKYLTEGKYHKPPANSVILDQLGLNIFNKHFIRIAKILFLNITPDDY